MEVQQVILAGAGNMAWHIGHALQKAGIQITGIYSRTPAHDQALAQQLATHTLTTSDFSNLSAQLVLLCLPDSALPGFVNVMQAPKSAVVAHTSGSTALSLLEAKFNKNAGVFYPLQTFTRGLAVSFKGLPILIEGASMQAKQLLTTLASQLGANSTEATSQQRQQLHLAAVFACNFTNHLLGISQELLQQTGLQADLLKPLITETITKAFANNPFTVQTGPASRHDEATLKMHLQLLKQQPGYQQVYTAISKNIQAIQQARLLSDTKSPETDQKP